MPVSIYVVTHLIEYSEMSSIVRGERIRDSIKKQRKLETFAVQGC